MKRRGLLLVPGGLALLAGLDAALLLLGLPAPVTTERLPQVHGPLLVLTIVGERVELARVALPDGAEPRALALCVALFAAVVGTSLWPGAAVPLLGATLLAVVGWLAVHDVARRTVHGTGLPRYMAWCLLTGYVWLAVAGAIWLVTGLVTGSGAYDAVVHAVFLGFTLSMIMAHAPVILLAVLGRPLPYRAYLMVAVGLLHASLVLRVVVGDAHGHTWALQLGGALNIVALLTFVVMAAVSAARGPRPMSSAAVRRVSADPVAVAGTGR